MVVGALRGGGGSALAIRAADALHDKGPGRGGVEGAQLIVAEPFGHQPGAERDEGEDDDGEADGRDGLGDGKGGAEGEQLDGHKCPDGGSAFQPGQGVVGVGEFAVAREEQHFLRHPVADQRLHAHDEEESRQHALRDQVEDDQERAGHGDEEEKALRQITDALFHHVVRHSDHMPFGFLVRDLAGHAKRIGVEWCLWDQSVGERDSQKSRDARGQSEEEDVPVEARWLAEGKFGSLRDEG